MKKLFGGKVVQYCEVRSVTLPADIEVAAIVVLDLLPAQRLSPVTVSMIATQSRAET
jgi:hypothetical protein